MIMFDTNMFLYSQFICLVLLLSIISVTPSKMAGSRLSLSNNPFREIAGLFRMAPRGHVETLTPHT